MPPGWTVRYGAWKEVANTRAVGGASWERGSTPKGSLQMLESRSQEGGGWCTLQTGHGEGAVCSRARHEPSSAPGFGEPGV